LFRFKTVSENCSSLFDLTKKRGNLQWWTKTLAKTAYI